MRIGARDLLDKYHGSQRAVAEAFVRGDITRIEEPFIWNVIGQDDVEAARGRLQRKVWKTPDRLELLEAEVKQLKERITQLEEQ
jgi:hypothetical protein